MTEPSHTESADRRLLETIRADGIGIMRDVLSADEIEAVREEFDQAHRDLGFGEGNPGDRDRITGESLFLYPTLSALYSHPRIMRIVSEMLKEPSPWVWQVITNRYNPEHVGVRKHTDGFLGELAPPFTRQSMSVFLDDIDESSGSLMYVPGTHLLHYRSDTEPDRVSPTQEDVDGGHYVPTKVNAGYVVFRVPEVWHAVIPIHRLRRYVTASYAVRGELSETMSGRATKEKARRTESGDADVPTGLRPYWM